MPVDVLEQGPEPPPTSLLRRSAVVLAALLVLGAAAVHGRGETPAAGRAGEEPLRPVPRVLLDRAEVLTVRPALNGALHARIGVEGVPRAQLLSVLVELPGTAVVLRPTPDRLTDDGRALVVVDLLPRCPDALAGLSKAAVTAVVRGREGARIRRVRVRLDTARVLDAVRGRCGPGAGVPELRASPVLLDGPSDDDLRTRVEVSAAGSQPLEVVDVLPGPGLETTVRTPLPVVLTPGASPVAVRVDLRLGGCGGAPDTPPYLLVLSTGETVATSVAAEVQPPLDALRPYQCAG